MTGNNPTRYARAGARGKGAAMTVKEWLMRGWRLNEEIDSLEADKRAAYGRLVAATYWPDETPVSGTREVHLTENLMQMAELVNRRTDELIGIKNEIWVAIFEVRNPQYRELLIKRYIEFKTNRVIAEEMHYCEKTIQRIHKKALEALSDAVNID